MFSATKKKKKKLTKNDPSGGLVACRNTVIAKDCSDYGSDCLPEALSIDPNFNENPSKYLDKIKRDVEEYKKIWGTHFSNSTDPLQLPVGMIVRLTDTARRRLVGDKVKRYDLSNLIWEHINGGYWSKTGWRMANAKVKAMAKKQKPIPLFGVITEVIINAPDQRSKRGRVRSAVSAKRRTQKGESLVEYNVAIIQDSDVNLKLWNTWLYSDHDTNEDGDEPWRQLAIFLRLEKEEEADGRSPWAVAGMEVAEWRKNNKAPLGKRWSHDGESALSGPNKLSEIVVASAKTAPEAWAMSSAPRRLGIKNIKCDNKDFDDTLFMWIVISQIFRNKVIEDLSSKWVGEVDRGENEQYHQYCRATNSDDKKGRACKPKSKDNSDHPVCAIIPKNTINKYTNQIDGSLDKEYVARFYKNSIKNKHLYTTRINSVKDHFAILTNHLKQRKKVEWEDQNLELQIWRLLNKVYKIFERLHVLINHTIPLHCVLTNQEAEEQDLSGAMFAGDNHCEVEYKTEYYYTIYKMLNKMYPLGCHENVYKSLLENTLKLRDEKNRRRPRQRKIATMSKWVTYNEDGKKMEVTPKMETLISNKINSYIERRAAQHGEDWKDKVKENYATWLNHFKQKQKKPIEIKIPGVAADRVTAFSVNGDLIFPVSNRNDVPADWGWAFDITGELTSINPPRVRQYGGARPKQAPEYPYATAAAKKMATAQRRVPLSGVETAREMMEGSRLRRVAHDAAHNYAAPNHRAASTLALGRAAQKAKLQAEAHWMNVFAEEKEKQKEEKAKYIKLLHEKTIKDYLRLMTPDELEEYKNALSKDAWHSSYTGKIKKIGTLVAGQRQQYMKTINKLYKEINNESKAERMPAGLWTKHSNATRFPCTKQIWHTQIIQRYGWTNELAERIPYWRWEMLESIEKSIKDDRVVEANQESKDKKEMMKLLSITQMNQISGKTSAIWGGLFNLSLFMIQGYLYKWRNKGAPGTGVFKHISRDGMGDQSETDDTPRDLQQQLDALIFGFMSKLFADAGLVDSAGFDRLKGKNGKLYGFAWGGADRKGPLANLDVKRDKGQQLGTSMHRSFTRFFYLFFSSHLLPTNKLKDMRDDVPIFLKVKNLGDIYIEKDHYLKSMINESDERYRRRRKQHTYAMRFEDEFSGKFNRHGMQGQTWYDPMDDQISFSAVVVPIGNQVYYKFENEIPGFLNHEEGKSTFSTPLNKEKIFIIKRKNKLPTKKLVLQKAHKPVARATDADDEKKKMRTATATERDREVMKLIERDMDILRNDIVPKPTATPADRLRHPLDDDLKRVRRRFPDAKLTQLSGALQPPSARDLHRALGIMDSRYKWVHEAVAGAPPKSAIEMTATSPAETKLKGEESRPWPWTPENFTLRNGNILEMEVEKTDINKVPWKIMWRFIEGHVKQLIFLIMAYMSCIAIYALCITAGCALLGGFPFGKNMLEWAIAPMLKASLKRLSAHLIIKSQKKAGAGSINPNTGEGGSSGSISSILNQVFFSKNEMRYDATASRLKQVCAKMKGQLKESYKIVSDLHNKNLKQQTEEKIKLMEIIFAAGKVGDDAKDDSTVWKTKLSQIASKKPTYSYTASINSPKVTKYKDKIKLAGTDVPKKAADWDKKRDEDRARVRKAMQEAQAAAAAEGSAPAAATTAPAAQSQHRFKVDDIVFWTAPAGHEQRVMIEHLVGGNDGGGDGTGDNILKYNIRYSAEAGKWKIEPPLEYVQNVVEGDLRRHPARAGGRRPRKKRATRRNRNKKKRISIKMKKKRTNRSRGGTRKIIKLKRHTRRKH